MVAFVAVTTKALHSAIEELGAVTAMVFDVVDDSRGRDDAALSPAQFAQRLLHQLVASPSTPTPVVVRTASGVAALAAAFGVERIE
jgi:hypothetical protein